MRIRTFSKFLELSELTPRVLRDASVVVDGHNLICSFNDNTVMTKAFGIEADRYARSLKKYLSSFKKANVTCYFLLKGGHADMEKRLDKNLEFVSLIREVYVQVLNEMEIQYVVCEYESKKDIIELARHLNCPIISYDIEFSFSGQQYIPSNTLQPHEDADNTCIHSGYFLLKSFLDKYNLTAEKLAVFIALTDEKIFPDGFFSELFQKLKTPPGPFKRNSHLLSWLSKNSDEQISQTISNYLSTDDKNRFVEEAAKARLLIDRRESGGLGAAWLLDRGAGVVARADPRWFAKGVANGFVPNDYINLYRSKIFIGAPECEEGSATLVALHIIKYAYDLLTDYKNDGFTLVYHSKHGNEKYVVTGHSVRKPSYEAEVCVFENGWDGIRSLGLLEHFLRETMQLESMHGLERAPEEARLLLLALAFYSRRRPYASAAVPAAALLAYVTLDLLHDKADRDNLLKPPFDRKPILDSITDKNEVTEEDCNIAAAIMEDYYTVNGTEHTDQKLLHSLAEYQECLLQLSGLAALCGGELNTLAWSRIYNGTLAYKLLYAADRAEDLIMFLDQLLSPAPTVYAFFNGIFGVYHDILSYKM